jgi:hypothetical protein
MTSPSAAASAASPSGDADDASDDDDAKLPPGAVPRRVDLAFMWHLDRGTVRDFDRSMMGLQRGIDRCYRRALDRVPSLRGRIEIALEIAANGEPTRVDVKTLALQPSVPDELVKDCFVRRFRRARFAPPLEHAAAASIELELRGGAP